jgi:hypothetical protein
MHAQQAVAAAASSSSSSSSSKQHDRACMHSKQHVRACMHNKQAVAAASMFVHDAIMPHAIMPSCTPSSMLVHACTASKQ